MIPLSKERFGLRPGQLIRLADRRVFKLGVVVGPSLVPGKIRVSPWQNASRSWSQPQAEDAAHLEAIHLSAISPRERGVVRRAQREVARHGKVAWSGGALTVSRVAP